ncbi:hypothetical protein MTR62_20865 [Novosphingobium sp. 1949]|uniref:Uncharacterized protein n=1 Tax=Novosphingobium organovorum TaxID=2930092 RepID=A0ABT0BJC2_9SPHN|nr:hypothetical protein [Novosphingobium organovorum]MCJ2185119.1 hypothetical protein [Novosphingobium organovorum]
MTSTHAALDAAQERMRIALLLRSYPAIEPDELARIHHWFRREATPLDFGILACEPETAEGYRAYRAQHYDRFGPRDLIVGAVFVAVVLGVLGLLYAAMP